MNGTTWRWTTRRMADLLGDKADADGYRSIMRRLKPAFLSAYWNGTRLASTESADDRANGLAVVAGMVGAAEWPAIRTVLARTNNASPYMEKYAEEAFFRMGDAKGGLARMSLAIRGHDRGPVCDALGGIRSSRRTQLFHQPRWSGGPLTLLSRHVAGVAPVKPGYAAFAVLPQLGDLTAVEAKVPSPRDHCREDRQGGGPVFSRRHGARRHVRHGRHPDGGLSGRDGGGDERLGQRHAGCRRGQGERQRAGRDRSLARAAATRPSPSRRGTGTSLPRPRNEASAQQVLYKVTGLTPGKHAISVINHGPDRWPWMPRSSVDKHKTPTFWKYDEKAPLLRFLLSLLGAGMRASSRPRRVAPNRKLQSRVEVPARRRFGRGRDRV